MRYLSQLLISMLLLTLSSLSYAQCGAPVPVCDADGDGRVNADDILAISLAKNSPANEPID